MNQQKDPQGADPSAPQPPRSERTSPSWLVWLQEKRNLAIGGAILIAVLILGVAYLQAQDDRQLNEYWAKVVTAEQKQLELLDEDRPDDTLQPEILRDAIEGVDAGSATAWGLMKLAKQYLAKKELEAAKQILLRIQNEFPTHWLNQTTDMLSPAESAAVPSIVQGHLDLIDQELTWEGKDQLVTKNPEPDQPIRAILETTEGEIRVGFHEGVAPRHVSNFVRLALEGFYDGLAIHHVQGPPAGYIRTGDPATREGAEVAEDRVEPVVLWEPSPLHQFAGAVSQVQPAKFGSTAEDRIKQSAELFDIFANDFHWQSANRTVFATVDEPSLEVVRKISQLEKDPENPTQLLEPVRITAIRFEGGEPESLLTEEDRALLSGEGLEEGTEEKDGGSSEVEPADEKGAKKDGDE